jgi:arylsulfatase A
MAMDRLTEKFFARGMQFIEANKDRPFFLLLTLTAPHVPLDPHPDHAGKSAAAEYGDVVEEIDTNMGRLFAQLKQLGIDNDTLVILTSDNGPWWEGSAGALRDRKGGAGWEGGYRVPFVARQPGRIPGGLVNDAIAMNIDLLPTLAAWTGAPAPTAQLDGRDISSLLTTRGAASPHEELVLFINEDVAAVRTQQWKYVVRSHYRGFLADLDGPTNRTDWDLLVDIQNDPGESYDVSSRHPDVLADMKARVAKARATFDPLRTPAPPPA